jgi:Spy/CpxP family protein refolding chaperone
MKKLLTLVFATLLGASLSFAQAGGSTDTKTPPAKTKKHSHGKKGGKKGKKSSGSTTPAPK